MKKEESDNNLLQNRSNSGIITSSQNSFEIHVQKNNFNMS